MTRMAEAEHSGIKAIVRLGLTRSAASLVIKMGTAGLTYLMFVVLARLMDTPAYGEFAFGMALATLLSIGASVGQQTAILRFWPEDEVHGDEKSARQAMQAGWALVLIASGVLTFGLAIIGSAYGAIGPGLGAAMHIVASALLILPMAAAEYGSSVLRAQGSVWTAMVPRDLLWRTSVPVVIAVLFFAGVPIGGTLAIVLTAVALALSMGLQIFASRRLGYENAVDFSALKPYWRKRGGPSKWFFMGTVVDSAGLNVDIVLVGLFVAASSAGLYFNAFRTAGLLTLFMYAITLVIAPMVARHYHSGELRKAQAVTAFCSWAGFLFSLLVFALYWFFGDLVLSLFGPEYAQGKTILIILSLGLLADAATGPTRIVMMMTGHERDYVRIFGGIMVVGLLAQLFVIPTFGIVAAAVVNAGSRFLAQSAAAWWTRRHVGIDTSLWGLVALFPGHAPQPVPSKSGQAAARGDAAHS